MKWYWNGPSCMKSHFNSKKINYLLLGCVLFTWIFLPPLKQIVFVEHKEPVTFTFLPTLLCDLLRTASCFAFVNVSQWFGIFFAHFLNLKHFFVYLAFLLWLMIIDWKRKLRYWLPFRPTLQPTLNPSQQFQPPISGQVNGPFPARQRSTLSNDSLVHFLKTMEMQFREKQLRSGEKLDGMCEDRFFCEIALIGRQPSADTLHRTLYAVALE